MEKGRQGGQKTWIFWLWKDKPSLCGNREALGVHPWPYLQLRPEGEESFGLNPTVLPVASRSKPRICNLIFWVYFHFPLSSLTPLSPSSPSVTWVM